MPKIPTYGPDLIDDQALPGVRQSSVASADSFVDKGLATLGAGMSKAGADLMDVAIKERAKVDEARVQEKYTLLSKAGNESLYGANGVTRLVGASAVGAADKWTADFDKTAEKLIEDLTPNQKQMFGKYSQTLKRGMYDNVLRHESAQVVAYQDQSYKELVSTAIDTAASSYRDGTLIGIQAGIALDAMRKRPEYAGASADVRAGMEKELRAGVHSAVIDRAIQQNDTAYANEYFGAVKDDIPLKYRSKIEAHLKPATDFAEGRDVATATWGKIKSGEMTVAEGELAITKAAKTRESLAVAQSVMRELQDADHRQSSAKEGALIEKFEMRPGRSTMNQIMGSAEYRNLEPEQRGKLAKYFRQELEQADDRFRARRNDQYRTPETYIKFMETLEDPKFAGMSRQELFAKRVELGPELTAKLLAEHKEVTTAAKRFQIDKDILQGMIPEVLRKPKTKQEEDQLRHFNGIVESELSQWKINNPGKIPTLEDQKKIAASANAEFNVVNKTLWFDGTVKAYELKPISEEFRRMANEDRKQKGLPPATEIQLLKQWSQQKDSRK